MCIRDRLDEFPKWKAFSLGDEDRRSIFIKHHNHHELGFIKHSKVLSLLDETAISVVPSKWEEPFGRTALEATSRGCATIISPNGGLTETTDHAIILKKLNSKNIELEINKLIKNNTYEWSCSGPCPQVRPKLRRSSDE